MTTPQTHHRTTFTPKQTLNPNIIPLYSHPATTRITYQSDTESITPKQPPHPIVIYIRVAGIHGVGDTKTCPVVEAYDY